MAETQPASRCVDVKSSACESDRIRYSYSAYRNLYSKLGKRQLGFCAGNGSSDFNDESCGCGLLDSEFEKFLNMATKSSFQSRRASDQPDSGRLGAARGRLRGAGDRRDDGGIDGQRRLTGQGPTAAAEPIDKAGSAVIAGDRVERIRRHQCTQVLARGGSRMRRVQKPPRRSRWRRSTAGTRGVPGLRGVGPSALRGC